MPGTFSFVVADVAPAESSCEVRPTVDELLVPEPAIREDRFTYSH